MNEPVTRADERDLAKRGVLELLADAHERPARLEGRLAEHLEQGGPLLDELEEAPVGVELLGAQLAEQVRGTADIKALLSRDELRERRAQRREKRALASAQARVLETPPEERGSDL